jgi:hypothetical protein
MSENDLEATLIEELRRDSRLTPVTERQARQYAESVDECDRLRDALAGLDVGSPEHKRASTALRGAERGRDTLGRALGLTDRARRERTKKRGSTVRPLHEHFTHARKCATSPGFDRGACVCGKDSK